MPEYRLGRFRGKFAVIWNEGGRRFRHSLGTDRRAEADQRLSRFVAAQAAAAGVAKGNAYTVADAWDGYVKALGAKPSAVTASHQWKAIGPIFADRNAATLTEADCQGYVEARRALGRSDSTIWSELSRLRSALKWAENKRLIDRAPKIWIPAPSPPRDKRMTREQVKAFIDACALPHVKLFAILAATTGARMGAILSLTWDRVDLERGLIHYADPTSGEDKEGPGHGAYQRAGTRRPLRGSQRRYDALRHRMGRTARQVDQEGSGERWRPRRDALGYGSRLPPLDGFDPRRKRRQHGRDRADAWSLEYAHGRVGLCEILRRPICARPPRRWSFDGGRCRD